MNTLDLVLCVFVLVYALSGYRQGFVVGAASTLGLLAGGFVGVEVTPSLLDSFQPSLSVSVGALLIVLLCAFTGQGVGALLGSRVRNRITWSPARTVDALGGGALSVAAMLLIAWVLGVAASGAQVGTLNQEIRDSRVLGAVDQALPGGADRVLSTFNSLVDSSRFPRYLEPFTAEHITRVRTPSGGVLRGADVRAAKASVAKIVGSASSCDRTLEGSGFVYAGGRVMTNAHVVAGVSHPTVSVNGSQHEGTVVYYNPEVDVAVLLVPGLDAPTLHFGTASGSGSPAAVLGYPENGPYDTEPARIRDRQTLRSPDIYGENTVLRDTYSIYSHVRPGNSGGPLVNARGEVVGVIFAASLTDPDTGYALTANQVRGAAASGATSTRAVSTGSCAD
jgi:S1-C subfamily serine protease